MGTSKSVVEEWTIALCSGCYHAEQQKRGDKYCVSDSKDARPIADEKGPFHRRPSPYAEYSCHKQGKDAERREQDMELYWEVSQAVQTERAAKHVDRRVDAVASEPDPSRKGHNYRV